MHRRRRARSVPVAAVWLATAVLVAVTAARAPAQPPAKLQGFLRDTIKLNDDELAAVEQGKVVTRLLPATDKGEIASFGIVKVAATADRFEALARDPARYYAMEGVDEIGVFSNPPVVDDVEALTLPSDDIDALKKCKPGSCDVKLTDDALARIAKIDWSKSDATARAAKGAREMVVEMAGAYRSGGLKALGTIVDKKEPKSRADEFHRLLQNSPYLYQYVPAFHDYIEAYPSGSFDAATTMLYWTRDSFSPKPVISVNSCTVVRSDESVLVASQLLAATHFFNAGLDVCVAVAVPGGGAGLYLVDVYRVRIDPPTGMLAGPAMKRVQDGTTKGVEKRLSAVVAKLK